MWKARPRISAKPHISCHSPSTRKPCRSRSSARPFEESSKTAGSSRAPSRRIQLTSEDSEGHVVTRVAQGDARTGLEAELISLCLGDVQGDGHREQGAGSETQVVAAAVRRSKSDDRASAHMSGKMEAPIVAPAR